MPIIDDFNTTIENLMKKEFGDPVPFGICFAAPRRDFACVDGKPTASFYLYDIREERKSRSNEPEVECRDDGTVATKRPPARIRLSYCVTAWSPAGDDALDTRVREEHRLLSDVLTILIRHPKIPTEVLSGDLVGQEPALPTKVLLPEQMENVAQFWNALDSTLKPFLDYRVIVSWDYSKEIISHAVSTKISGYGGTTAVYALSVRSELRCDHGRGISLSRVRIESTPAVSMDGASVEGDDHVTVTTTDGLTEGDFLMIVDGRRTEICQLGAVPGVGVPIPIDRPLFFGHAKGTELKRLGRLPEQIDLKLAANVSAKSVELEVVGTHAAGLKVGDVLGLNGAQRIECVQIVRITGPRIGLGASETIVQIGGTVTNSADSPAPIAGAKVTLLDGQGVRIAETATDLDGRYALKTAGIGAGKCRLKVQAQGYEDQERTIDEIASATIKDFLIRLASQ